MLCRVIVLVIVLLLTACSQQLQGGPPSIDLSWPVDRNTASLVETTRLGSDTYKRSAGAAEIGSSLLLAAGSQPEYAVYVFHPYDGSVLQDLTVTLDAAQTTAAWLGIADYQSGHWSLSGPYSSSTALALPATALSPAGNVYVAVIAAMGESVRIVEVKLGEDAANLPPTVNLTSDVPAGDPPFAATLTAEASDPDNNIDHYEWDLDNNGIFELNTGSSPQTSFDIVSAGTFTASVRVVDAEGLSVTDSVEVIGHGWVALEVPGAAESCASTSLLEVGGAPAIAYIDDSSQQAKYVRPSQGDGTHSADWDSIIVVDSGFTDPSAQDNLKLTLINGKPAFGYCAVEAGQKRLKYARSDSATGSAVVDWHTMVVDTAGQNAMNASLAEVNGVPAIAFMGAGDFDAWDLKYALADLAEPNSSSDWSVVALGWNNLEGGHASLAVVAGNPAISCVDLNMNVEYRRSSTSTGSQPIDWPQPVAVADINMGIQVFTSLAVVAGKPAIAYYDDGPLDLHYTRSSTATGDLSGDWSLNLALDSPISGDNGCSLAVVNGLPAIAYHKGGLGFAGSSTLDGVNQADWQTFSVDPSSGGLGVGRGCSLAQVNGNSAISYIDSDSGALKYAVLL